MTSRKSLPCRRVGEFLIVTLSGGSLPIGMDSLANIDADVAFDLQSQADDIAPGSIHLNAYLVRGQGRNVLIDSGLDHQQLVGSLAELGVTPAAVDTVLLTHAHPDHVGGLLDEAGAAAFPNAELVLDQREFEFWQDDGPFARALGRSRTNFLIARRAFAGYAGRVRTVSAGAVLPGIQAVDLAGHTVGHTGYRLESAGQSLLVWGDVVHFPGVQVACPEATVRFDQDPSRAVATRRRIFDQVSDEGILVAGMHLGQPGFVRIRRAGDRYQLLGDGVEVAST
ncbi:MBL fold metallo-hydrolase [Pseudomonas rhizoryzae]|uniref:MBL fold metallo-hydrolase n=1 Tax=Pseudomonas rhizoryzae TaxID=2571129 RepID=UPI000736BA10|nr:MBL fold metallo-hydrolase [Pseudomonas rhizoryzae]KTT29329.1 beta-lactamase [Pseudomonas psychrotolerans]KTT37643.1 beta-lactamase [Pseudomonas psychrotolerans]KTT72564.1 beta-lactamase [Pseudomonas psychrotolerans]